MMVSVLKLCDNVDCGN